jgi:hypothetical protein
MQDRFSQAVALSHLMTNPERHSALKIDLLHHVVATLKRKRS